MGLAAVGIAGWFAWPVIGKSEWFAGRSTLTNLSTDVVRRGPFQVTVTERGTLDSMRNAVLSSKVEGSTAIISIVPEGTHVKEGDIVCELDSSTLKDKEVQQTISFTSAQSLYDQAKENVEIQKTQNDSDIAAAKLKLELAILDKDKYLQGDYEQQRKEMEGAVELAREDLTRSKEDFDYNERLTRKGYKTQNDLEASRIAVRKAELAVSVAEEKLRVLSEFTYKRQIKELDANAKEFARELERTERKALATLAQTESELAAKDLTLKVETSKLDRLRQQIEFCIIRAPQDGQVIYANKTDGRSDSIQIEEGAMVRERQAIINLPDLDKMKVNARVHESRISLIRAGLPVSVKIDAVPDKVFQGELDTVSSVPSSTNFFNRDVKEYEAIVRLLDTAEKGNRLRPGLTAGVEILVEQRDDVLQTPVQSIITVAARQFAFVVKGKRVERREVKVGQTNDRTIEVLSGLDENDVVVMNPRSQFATELVELETQLVKEQAEEAAKNPQPVGVPSAVPTGAPGPGGRPPGAGGPPDAGGAGGPGRGPGGGGPSEGGVRPDPVARFKQMDANSDGKITEDEADERMKSRFATFDADGDGGITQEEMSAATARFRAAGGAGGQGGGRPPGNAGGGSGG